MTTPYASVVVPTLFGRPELLAGAVKALCALDYPDYEVVLVDNRSNERRDERDWRALPADPRLRIVAQPRPGISAARNAGVRAARGEFIAFTDDDVEVDPGWLRALGERFAAEPDADAVTGAVLPKELETEAQRWFERYGAGSARDYRSGSYATAGRVWRVRDRIAGTEDWLYRLGPFGTGANMAFRAGTLTALGGFDEALGAGTPTGGGEDIEMFVRLLARGYRLAVEPAAYVWHTHRRTGAELREQMAGYGRGLTAMLTAAILRDPRHLVGLLLIAVPGTVSVLKPGKSSAPRLAEDPQGARLSGLLHGPAAYFASRRKMRRWNG